MIEVEPSRRAATSTDPFVTREIRAIRALVAGIIAVMSRSLGGAGQRGVFSP
jgi:hypothetical protein